VPHSIRKSGYRTTTTAGAAVVECKREASDDKHTTISAMVNVSAATVSSKTEPASEPHVETLGTTTAEAAVVECKDEASDDKHISISAMVNVSAATASSKTESASEPPVEALGTTTADAAVVECKDEASDDKHTTISAMVNVSAATASSTTEPASEPPVEVLGTTTADAAVVECKDEESDDKHISIGAMVSVSAATACEHPATAEGDVALDLNQALAGCKATTTTGEAVVVMKPQGQPCNQLTRTGEVASDIRSAPSCGLEEVSIWEYNPAHWVIRGLIGYMFISNLMLMQQHIC
jgi:hypothetical protein